MSSALIDHGANFSGAMLELRLTYCLAVLQSSSNLRFIQISCSSISFESESFPPIPALICDWCALHWPCSDKCRRCTLACSILTSSACNLERTSTSGWGNVYRREQKWCIPLRSDCIAAPLSGSACCQDRLRHCCFYLEARQYFAIRGRAAWE